MHKIFPIIIIFSLSIVFANDDNSRVFVYIHPYSLVASIVGAGMGYSPVAFYITGEFPVSKSISVIANPSLLKGNIDVDYFRIGSGIGIRKYLWSLYSSNKPGPPYFQLLSSAHYRNADKNIPGFMVDILGYLGFTPSKVFKFDFGVGYEYSYLKRHVVDNDDKMVSGINFLNSRSL